MAAGTEHCTQETAGFGLDSRVFILAESLMKAPSVLFMSHSSERSASTWSSMECWGPWNNFLREFGSLLTGIGQRARWDDRLARWSHSGTRGGCSKAHSVAFGEIPLRIYVFLIARAPHSSTTVNWNDCLRMHILPSTASCPVFPGFLSAFCIIHVCKKKKKPLNLHWIS